jgi:hypothetical protein
MPLGQIPPDEMVVRAANTRKVSFTFVFCRLGIRKKLTLLARPNPQPLMFRINLPRKSYPFAANVYPQDELRGAHKVELRDGNKVALFAGNKIGPASEESAFDAKNLSSLPKTFRMILLQQPQNNWPGMILLQKMTIRPGSSSRANIVSRGNSPKMCRLRGGEKALSKSFRMTTYQKTRSNPFGITSFTKKGRGRGCVAHFSCHSAA